MASDIFQQYRESTSNYFADRIDYEKVAVLPIYWKENDLKPEAELKALRTLFKDDYGYHVLNNFLIPPKASQQLLNHEIAKFVCDWSDKQNTLILVYYAGHCFYGEDGKDVRWAA